MRWAYREDVVPSNGDRRVRRMFAWKPTKIGQQMVWLEPYEVVEVFYAGWWSKSEKKTIDFSRPLDKPPEQA